MTGLNAAFAFFGAAGRNPRWSWSARSPDGKVVVVTMWKDLITRQNGRMVYDDSGRDDLPNWKGQPGNAERIENLKWAMEHCGGLVRTVITVAKDPNVSPRDIVDCFPQRKLVMSIERLNQETGEVRLVSIDSPVDASGR
jgi:hypothetical protein